MLQYNMFNSERTKIFGGDMIWLWFILNKTIFGHVLVLRRIIIDRKPKEKQNIFPYCGIFSTYKKVKRFIWKSSRKIIVNSLNCLLKHMRWEWHTCALLQSRLKLSLALKRNIFLEFLFRILKIISFVTTVCPVHFLEWTDYTTET